MRTASPLPLFRLALVAGLALLPLFGGCGLFKPKAQARSSAQASPSPTPFPVRTVVGQIAVVDEEKRFVLIDLGSNLYVPDPGAALRSTHASGESARLKASPEQKRPFIAADIVEGKPQVGDEVER